MNAPTSTVSVEIDSGLLGQLRERHPGKDDRSLLEELARIELGFDRIAEIQSRVGVDPDQASEIAVRAVREARSESA